VLSLPARTSAWLAAGLASAVLPVLIALEAPTSSLTAAGLLASGGVVLAVMFVSARYELTLLAYGAYLALLDGSLRLATGVGVFTVIRDVLLLTIVAGALAKLVASRGQISIPPYSGFILIYATFVLAQVFNPNEWHFLHGVGAIRQHLEFVPLFFFGFAVMRTTGRLRAFLVFLVVVAALNGIVGLIQARLTPAQLATWGPGYADRVNGTTLISARVFYDAAGTSFVRPFALGSDLGFGGNVGLIAVPAGLALFISGGGVRRRLWLVPVVTCAVLAVVTSQNREAIIGAVVAALAFAGLAVAGRRVMATIVGVLVALAVGYLVVSIVGRASGSHIFDRYQSIAPTKVFSTTYDYRKDDFALFGEYVGRFPLGAGLGSGGPAVGFFGGSGPRALNSETEFNFLLIELGIPGVLLLVWFNLRMLALATRVRRLAASGPRLELAAVGAALFGLTATWVAGATTSTVPGGPYFWFAAGILTWWTRTALNARSF
jgi:hypothetical protein